MSIRFVIKKVHLWLGLSSGLVVFILGLTGCLYVFQPQITHWARSDLRHADVVASQTLPMQLLQREMASAMGVERLSYGLTTFRDPDRNWQTFVYKGSSGHWTYFGNIVDYRTGYINPYTGNVEGIVNEEHDFFQIVKGIHWSLLLATPIGQPVVTWSTVIFLVLTLTGLVLWWPARWNKSGRRKSFLINRKASWKRINYDLHNVLGFYALLVFLVIGATGLYWYFPQAPKVLHWLGTGEYSLPVTTPTPVADAGHVVEDRKAQTPLERAYAQAWSRFPHADDITFVLPAAGKDVIRARVQPKEGRYYKQSYLVFDAGNGQLIKQRLYADMNAGAKLVAMNYDLHLGTIAGLWGQLIALIVSVIATGLPVTGFIYWYPTWRRKRQRKRLQSKALVC